MATVPVLLKGIVAPEDARLAVEHGADGIIVSGPATDNEVGTAIIHDQMGPAAANALLESDKLVTLVKAQLK